MEKRCQLAYAHFSKWLPVQPARGKSCSRAAERTIVVLVHNGLEERRRRLLPTATHERCGQAVEPAPHRVMAAAAGAPHIADAAIGFGPPGAPGAGVLEGHTGHGDSAAKYQQYVQGMISAICPRGHVTQPPPTAHSRPVGRCENVRANAAAATLARPYLCRRSAAARKLGSGTDGALC